MKKNIYTNAFNKPKKEEIKKQVDYYSVDSGAVKKVQSQISELREKLELIEKSTSKINPIVTVKMPKIQDVKVTNQPEPTKIVFPEIQDVKVTNQPEITIEKVDMSRVEQTLEAILTFKRKKQDIQRVELTNPTSATFIPIGRGNKPKEADPEIYVPVRLTDGKRFYNALQDAYVAAAKASKLPLWATTTTSGLTNQKFTIKASAGEFGGYYYYNPNSSAVYIQVFDNANPTVGVDAPKLVFGVPATGGANIEIGRGVGFGSAITAFATNTAGGGSAPTLPIPVNFYYL